VKLDSISETSFDGPAQNDVLDKLGLTAQNLTPDLANQFGYENMQGVLINSVKPGSPAAFAGLRPGMLILEANQETVKSISELSKALESSLKTKKVLLLVRDRRTARYVSFSLE
jgi:serine protease Do